MPLVAAVPEQSPFAPPLLASAVETGCAALTLPDVPAVPEAAWLEACGLLLADEANAGVKPIAAVSAMQPPLTASARQIARREV